MLKFKIQSKVNHKESIIENLSFNNKTKKQIAAMTNLKWLFLTCQSIWIFLVVMDKTWNYQNWPGLHEEPVRTQQATSRNPAGINQNFTMPVNSCWVLINTFLVPSGFPVVSWWVPGGLVSGGVLSFWLFRVYKIR